MSVLLRKSRCFLTRRLDTSFSSAANVFENTDRVLIEDVDQVRYIKLNNPKTKNSICTQTFEQAANAMREANDDDDVGMVVFGGTGEFFTSGNDQSSLINSWYNV